jgi:hypothetical protein|tara:strand:+ start:1937 stop:2242 length:306 start_codon:yes stop_codon:yes gene_type:complete
MKIDVKKELYLDSNIEVCLAVNHRKVFLVREQYFYVNGDEKNTVVCISLNPEYIAWIVNNCSKVITLEDLKYNNFFKASGYSTMDKYSKELLIHIENLKLT